MKHPFLTLLGLLLLFGGCSKREIAVLDSRRIPTPKIEGEFEGLAIKKVHANHEGDILSVQVEVQNQRSHSLQFEYRYLWFDYQGRIFDMPDSRWLKKTLTSKDSTNLPGVAPHSSIKDYVLKIKTLP